MVLIDECNVIYPEIMGANKKIHEKAAGVLLKENRFTWDLYGCQYQSMWHLPYSEKTLCSRHYSRLITMMSLNISTRGDRNDVAQADAMYLTTKSVYRACQRLALKDLKILKIDFIISLGRRLPDWTRSVYY